LQNIKRIKGGSCVTPRTILQPGRVFLTCDFACSAPRASLKESFQFHSPSVGGRLVDDEGAHARDSASVKSGKQVTCRSHCSAEEEHRSQIRDQPPRVLGHFLSGQSFEKAQPRLALLKSSVRCSDRTARALPHTGSTFATCVVVGYHAHYTALHHNLLTQSFTSVGNQFSGPLPPTVAESLL